MFAAVGAVRPKKIAMPMFYAHASKALRAAQSASGCAFAATHFHDGKAFSLTVWESSQAMAAYARGPGHAPAMRGARITSEVFHFHHFEVDSVPTWSEAIARWEAATPEAA